MRRRGFGRAVLLASLALGTPAARKRTALKMYRVTVEEEGAGTLGALGVDLGHTGYKRPRRPAQTIFVDLLDAQAAEAAPRGSASRRSRPGRT